MTQTSAFLKVDRRLMESLRAFARGFNRNGNLVKLRGTAIQRPGFPKQFWPLAPSRLITNQQQMAIRMKMRSWLSSLRVNEAHGFTEEGLGFGVVFERRLLHQFAQAGERRAGRVTLVELLLSHRQKRQVDWIRLTGRLRIQLARTCQRLSGGLELSDAIQK